MPLKLGIKLIGDTRTKYLLLVCTKTAIFGLLAKDLQKSSEQSKARLQPLKQENNLKECNQRVSTDNLAMIQHCIGSGLPLPSPGQRAKLG